MLPEQVLVNSDVVSYFCSVDFLCLTCPPEVLRSRLVRRDGSDAATANSAVWVAFNSALAAAAREIPTATVLDAAGAVDQVAADVRHWITTRLHGGDSRTAIR